MLTGKKLLTRISFGADILLFTLLTIAGWHWMASLAAVESVMWMVRLIWISPGMLRFILRRFIHMIPIIVAVIAIGFFLLYLTPGDVFTQMSMNPDIQPETVERMRKAFGLDQPWYVQFFKYLWSALHGDFGFSQMYKAPVFSLVSSFALNTLLLAFLSLLFAWGFSIPAGIFAATHQYRWQDQSISVLAFVGLSIPNFFLAFLLSASVVYCNDSPGFVNTFFGFLDPATVSVQRIYACDNGIDPFSALFPLLRWLDVFGRICVDRHVRGRPIHHRVVSVVQTSFEVEGLE